MAIPGISAGRTQVSPSAARSRRQNDDLNDILQLVNSIGRTMFGAADIGLRYKNAKTAELQQAARRELEKARDARAKERDQLAKDRFAYEKERHTEEDTRRVEKAAAELEEKIRNERRKTLREAIDVGNVNSVDSGELIKMAGNVLSLGLEDVVSELYPGSALEAYVRLGLASAGRPEDAHTLVSRAVQELGVNNALAGGAGTDPAAQGTGTGSAAQGTGGETKEEEKARRIAEGKEAADVLDDPNRHAKVPIHPDNEDLQSALGRAIWMLGAHASNAWDWGAEKNREISAAMADDLGWFWDRLWGSSDQGAAETGAQGGATQESAPLGLGRDQGGEIDPRLGPFPAPDFGETPGPVAPEGAPAQFIRDTMRRAKATHPMLRDDRPRDLRLWRGRGGLLPPGMSASDAISEVGSYLHEGAPAQFIRDTMRRAKATHPMLGGGQASAASPAPPPAFGPQHRQVAEALFQGDHIPPPGVAGAAVDDVLRRDLLLRAGFPGVPDLRALSPQSQQAAAATLQSVMHPMLGGGQVSPTSPALPPAFGPSLYSR